MSERPKFNFDNLGSAPSGKSFNFDNLPASTPQPKKDAGSSGLFTKGKRLYQATIGKAIGPAMDFVGQFNPGIAFARDVQKDIQATKEGRTIPIAERNAPFAANRELSRGVGKSLAELGIGTANIAEMGVRSARDLYGLKPKGQDFDIVKPREERVGTKAQRAIERRFDLEKDELITGQTPTEKLGKTIGDIATIFAPQGALTKAGTKLAASPRTVSLADDTAKAAANLAARLRRSPSTQEAFSKAARGTVTGAARVTPEAAGDVAITAAQTEDPTLTAVAAALPYGFGALFRAGSLGADVTRSTIAPYLKRAEEALESYAMRPGANLAEKGADDVLQTLVDDIAFERTTGQKAAGSLLRGIDSLRTFNQTWTDTKAPFKKIDKALEEYLGRPLDPSESLYYRASTANPIIQQQKEQILGDLSNLTERLGNVSPDFDKVSAGLLVKLDELNRARNGKIVTKGRTAEELDEIVRKAKESLSPEQAEAFETARTYIQNMNIGLLNQLKDAGSISTDEMRRLIQSNPDYIPHEVMLETMEGALKDLPEKGMFGATINQSKKILQEAKGSERALKDPFVALANRFAAMQEVAENNKTIRSMIEQVEKMPSLFPEFKAIDTAAMKQGRIALMQALGEATREQKRTLKLLRQNKQYSDDVTKEIDKTLKQIAEQEDELRRMSEAYFADEPMLGTAGKTRYRIKTIADELIPTAEQVRQFNTLEEFIDSSVARRLEREVQSGKMEVLGFPGDEDKVLREFYEAAKGIGRFTGGKGRQKTITAAQLGEKQKQILKQIEGLQQNVQINKVSADEATRYAARTLKEITEAKNSIRAGIDDMKKLEVSDLDLKESGLGKVNFFRDGIKETWVVPRDIEVAVKGLNSQQMSKLFRNLVLPNRLMRRFATGANVGFFIPNIARDLQTAALTADEGIAVDVFLQAAFGKNPELAAKAASEGAFFGASIYDIDDPFVKSRIKDITDAGLMQKIKKASTFDMVEEFANKLENATRLAAYAKVLRNGGSQEKAVQIARNVTVDFNKMGALMQPLNQLIPFLNARVQGVLNIGRALKENPELFMRRQYITSVLPTVELYSHNREFETFQNIPPYVHQNFWVYMIGEIEATDEAGNIVKYPQFISIPKGEGQKLISNPIEYFFRVADNIDDRAMSEVLLDNALAITPITFQSLTTDDLASGVISAFGPVPRVITGAFSGKDPFTGLPIVPASREDAPPELQYSDRTPEVTKKIAQSLGISPAKLQFGAESFIPVTKDIATAVDRAVLGEQDRGLTNTTFGQLSRTPVLRSFVRESTDYYNPQNQRLRDIIDEIRQSEAGEDVLEKEKERLVKDELLKVPAERRELRMIELVRDGVITRDESKEITKQMKENLRPTERELDALGVNNFAKATAIYRFIQTMDDAEQRKYLDELEEKGIMSKQVERQVKLLDRYGSEEAIPERLRN